MKDFPLQKIKDVVVIVAFVAVIVISLMIFSCHWNMHYGEGNLSGSPDMITFFFSAVTLLLTILGFGLAVLAFFGYESLRKLVAEQATEGMKEAINKYLESDKDNLLIEHVVTKAIAGYEKNKALENLSDLDIERK